MRKSYFSSNRSKLLHVHVNRALQEAQETFGVDFDYEDFSKYDEEYDEEDEEEEDEYVDDDEDSERRYII